MNSHEVFIHIHQGCFAGTWAIVRLPQCQLSKPDGYGKISQCITTTKHSKVWYGCRRRWGWRDIFLVKIHKTSPLFLVKITTVNIRNAMSCSVDESMTPPQHEAPTRDWLSMWYNAFGKNVSCGEKIYFLWRKIYFLRKKNMFLAEKNIFLAEKNISCGNKYFLRKNIFLAEKNLFLAEKNMFLAEKNIFLAEKKMFLAEKNISCGKIYFLRRKIYFLQKKICFLRRKIYFLRRKIFLAEKKNFLRKNIFVPCYQ